MNLFPTEKQIIEADARNDAIRDDKLTGDRGPGFHELWAAELDALAAFGRAKRIGDRAWKRLAKLPIDSEAFRIRMHRACAIAAKCDELYGKIHT